jgi:hypothetical protein
VVGTAQRASYFAHLRATSPGRAVGEAILYSLDPENFHPGRPFGNITSRGKTTSSINVSPTSGRAQRKKNTPGLDPDDVIVTRRQTAWEPATEEDEERFASGDWRQAAKENHQYYRRQMAKWWRIDTSDLRRRTA